MCEVLCKIPGIELSKAKAHLAFSSFVHCAEVLTVRWVLGHALGAGVAAVRTQTLLPHFLKIALPWGEMNHRPIVQLFNISLQLWCVLRRKGTEHCENIVQGS